MKTITHHASRIIVCILLTLALIALPAFADVGTQNTSCTNLAAAATTTTANLGSAVKVDSTDSVGVTIKFSGSAAGTGAVVWRMVRSPNGIDYESTANNYLVCSNALAGATSITNYYSIPSDYIRGAQYVKLLNIQNYDASANATNLSIIVSTKNAKPGR